MVELSGDGDFAQEAFGAKRGGQLAPQDFEGDLPVVLEIVGEIDDRHAAGTEFPVDAVALPQRGGEAFAVGHHVLESTPCSVGAQTARQIHGRSPRSSPHPTPTFFLFSA